MPPVTASVTTGRFSGGFTNAVVELGFWEQAHVVSRGETQASP